MHAITPDDPAFNALPRAGENILVDKTTRRRYPAASAGSLLLTAARFGWSGIIVEQHRLSPAEMPEHSVIGHGISVNVGAYNEVSLIIDPQFVANVVEDGLAANRIEFVSQHSVVDSVIVYYATKFREELTADTLNGAIYGETATIGLVLHLLANYGVAKPKLPSPRGKLNAFQLRSVVDFVDAHISADVSLVSLAQQAHVSPFHFARLFRRTLGVTPHQFVMQLRVLRALSLMKARTLSLAQIAVECGFHDQPHLTKAFRKLLGTTPGAHPLAGQGD